MEIERQILVVLIMRRDTTLETRADKLGIIEVNKIRVCIGRTCYFRDLKANITDVFEKQIEKLTRTLCNSHDKFVERLLYAQKTGQAPSQFLYNGQIVPTDHVSRQMPSNVCLECNSGVIVV